MAEPAQLELASRRRWTFAIVSVFALQAAFWVVVLRLAGSDRAGPPQEVTTHP